MARVMLVVGDTVVRQRFARLLERAGHEIIVARAHESQSLSRARQPEVAILDAGLDDLRRKDVLLGVKKAIPSTAIVVVDEHPTVRAGVEAIQAGASEYLEHSGAALSLSAVVTRLSASGQPARLHPADPASNGSVEVSPIPHAVERWVSVVVPVLDSPRDLNTIALWASWVAVSPGAIRNWCRTAGLPAKRSLSLARILRVVVRDPTGAESAENMLDIVDLRSLSTFMKLGSPTARPHQLPLGVDEVLSLQRWVTDPMALRELKAALNGRRSNDGMPGLSRRQRVDQHRTER